MPGIPHRTYQQLLWNLRSLRERMRAAHALYLTYDEGLELMVADEEKRAIIKGAVGVIEPYFSWHSKSLEFDDVVVVSLAGYQRLWPADISLNENAAALPKIKQWVDEVYEFEKQFAYAAALLGHFHHYFKSPSQVRYVWPVLQTIASVSSDAGDENMQKFLASIRNVKTPNTVPFMSVDMRNACRTTAGAITGASLLPAELPTPKTLDTGGFSLKFSTTIRFKLDGNYITSNW